MPITFDKNYSNLIKLAIALVKTFRMIYCLTDFSDVHTFPFFLVMTSFLVAWASNLHILWNLLKAITGLQSFSAVGCLDQVLQRDYINTMMTSL